MAERAHFAVPPFQTEPAPLSFGLVLGTDLGLPLFCERDLKQNQTNNWCSSGSCSYQPSSASTNAHRTSIRFCRYLCHKIFAFIGKRNAVLDQCQRRRFVMPKIKVRLVSNGKGLTLRRKNGCPKGIHIQTETSIFKLFMTFRTFFRKRSISSK